MKITEYIKRKEFLICVDSDGCAMDTMDIKHFQCFGPCMISEWNLQSWEEVLLKRWNEINLYTMTRGINRFKGLAMILREVNDHYTSIEEIEILERWVKESDELSNAAIERVLSQKESIILRKALSWSNCVNASINEIPFSEKKPFEGVKEALAYAHEKADIAIVSSANLQAVVEEWELYGLLDYVDVILAQDTGSKAYCISELLNKGYDRTHVMMTGDALGDYEAAKKNDVYYYPILVRHEKESWEEFQKSAVEHLLNGTYEGKYQEEKVKVFLENLS